MARFLHRNLSNVPRKWSSRILALSWCAGLLSGVALFHDAGDFLVSLMPMAVSGHVSIVDLLSSLFLPFLIAALAVYMGQPWLLALLAFVHASCYTFISCGVLNAYGSAGWLVWILFMFHNILASVVLYFYCRRNISAMKRISFTENCLVSVINLAVAGLEYGIISPFLTELFIT